MKVSALILTLALLFSACTARDESVTPPNAAPEELESPGDGGVQSESPSTESGQQQADRLRDFVQGQNRVVGLLYGYIRRGLAACVSVSDPGAFTACFDRAAERFERARRAFDEWRPTVEPSLREAGIEYTPAVIRAWLRAIGDIYAHERGVLARFRACLGAALSSADVSRCLSEIAPLVLEGVELQEALGRAERAARKELPFAA